MKPGIDFFPLDVALDEKWELIEAEFGLTGFSVVVKLLQRIYGGQGYYCECTREVALLFAKKIGLGGGVVPEIISPSINRGIFDKTLYDKYAILTSVGIQKRYFEAVSRRKSVKVDPRYLLVPYAQNFENDNKNEKNVDIFKKNVDIFEQSKVEESKVKDTTTNAHARGKYQNVVLTDSDIADLQSEGIPIEYIDYFSERLKEGHYHYSDHTKTIRDWWKRDRDTWQQEQKQRSEESKFRTFDPNEAFENAIKRGKRYKTCFFGEHNFVFMDDRQVSI